MTGFFDIQKKVFTGYFEARYEEALETALEAVKRFPDSFTHR